MSIDFISRHPKLVFLLIGLALLVPALFGTSKLYDMVIEEKQSRIEELTTKLIQREATITTLTEYNKKLSQKVKTVRIVKPDGSIKEVTESDTNSETQISQSVKEEYKETIKEEVSKLREEFSRTISERKKLTISGGVSLSMDYYVQGYYQFWGPFGMGASMTFPNQEYLFGIGVSL